jgi:5-formyltetrahydrofolate cyclo-ligase
MSKAIDQAKRSLRAELRERRVHLSEAQREAAATAIAERLDALIADHGATSISCYLSTVTEPGTREFVTAAVKRGIRVLLPITREDGLLDWAVSDDTDETVEGLFGVPEPLGEMLGPIAVGDVDLMFIPAAAISRSGMRLGWGRGYFDKTLGSMQQRPPVYAIVYDTELMDNVPHDSYDQAVDGVVTPSQTITFG